jgi:hypothetical protein
MPSKENYTADQTEQSEMNLFAFCLIRTLAKDVANTASKP